MNCYRRVTIVLATLLGAAAALLLLSLLLLPSEVQAQYQDGHYPDRTAVPHLSADYPSQSASTAPARPWSEATQPRTVTAPRQSFDLETIADPGWRQPYLSGMRQDGRAPAGADAARPAGLHPQSLPPGMTVDLAYNVVMGWVAPGELITVTTPTGYGAAVADGVGFFWTPIWYEDGYAIEIVPGELVNIFVGGEMTFTVVPPHISGGLDVPANTAGGLIDGDGGGTPVSASFGLWAQPPFPGAPVANSVTAGDGSFTLAFDGVDLGAENLVALDVPVDGVNVRSYLYPEPAVFLAQQYNLIAGYGPVGQPVVATVYAGYPGDVRWSGESWAEPPHGYYWFFDVEMETGDVIIVELHGGVTLSTTVIELGNLTFDTGLDEVQGTAPEGATVRATLWQWQNGDLVYQQAHTVADAGDQFTLNYGADLRPRDNADVIVADSNGHQIQLFSGPAFVSAWDDPYSDLDCVVGRLDGPGLPITVSLTTADQTYVRDTGWSSDAGNGIVGCFLIRDPDWAWGPINFSPGDIATLQSPTWQGDVDVVAISWYADTAANSIGGDAPAGDLEITLFQWHDWGYPLQGAATRTTVAASPFAADFSGFDVRDGNQLILAHFDPVTGYGNRTADWGRPTLPYSEIYLPYGVGGMVLNPHEMVTAQLYDETHAWLAESSDDHDGDPWRFWLSDFDGFPLAPGYWITLTSETGWTAGMEIPYLAIDGDPETDLVTAVGPTGLLYLDGGREDSGFGAFVPGPAAVLNTTALGHDLQRSDVVGVTYQAANGNRARRDVRLNEVHRVEFWLDPNGPDWMWGAAEEGAVVTITTPFTQVVVWADPDCGGCWGIAEPIDVNSGDTVIVTAGDGLFPVTIAVPDPITAAADSDLDQVWGQIGGRIEDWLEIHGGWPDGYQETLTDANGYFAVTYDDVPRGGQGYIRFGSWIDEADVIVHQPFQTPDLILRANYAHDWVEGNYEAGHTVWLTLTNEAGTVKATAIGTTGPIPWWGGATGFATTYNVPWAGQQPDIEPGDWVHTALSNGQSAVLQIGTIEGVLDVDNDTVSGTIHAPWFGEPLDGGCGVWVENGIWIPFTVDPDGGAYLCDLGAEGWDLVPGQMVGVEYREPDGDVVYNIFEEPAPRVAIDKWANGQPGEGGNFVFQIHYRNEGGAPAEDVVITDTMQGFAYLGDTGGFPFTSGTTPGGDPYVAWELGTLGPYESAEFELFVTVTAATGEPVRNTAEIATSNPYNTSEPWQLESIWDGEVVENDTNVNVAKWAWTWDPAPGHDFVYGLSVCNHGSTGSTAATVTDTLPLSTTLVGWWAREAGWQEVDSGPHLLVVERPSLQPGSCTDVFIRVHLDEAAWPGMELVNTAVISAANDLNPDDNEAIFWHQAGVPYKDLAIDLAWHWGTLVPGGHLRYGIYFRNQGNLPVDGPILITATLPSGTTFNDWSSWDWADVSLVQVTDDHVIWQVNGLDGGYYGSLELALDVAPDALPGTLLVNQVEIAVQPDEVDVGNNYSTWEEILYDHGPNLRLRKYGEWHGHGEGHNAWYRLEVENVGDQTIDNVTITDTYPVEMNLDGGVHVDFHLGWEWLDHPDDHYLTVMLESLQPGWSVYVYYNTLIPGDDPIPLGLLFSNTAVVVVPPGDTNPADNSATATLASGPDLYVEKSLVAGDFLPGELVTFKLRFGNDQPGHAWWWHLQGDAWLTDTLPAGMNYVAAYQRWCGVEVPQWCVRDPDEMDGQNLLWNMGPLGASHWNEILLTVHISENATGLDTLTNWATIASDQPAIDIEPYYDNNSSSYQGTINLPYFTISKSYVSSRIAGLPVTYNLTVQNMGHAGATGLVITDALPPNVTYVSGGSFNSGTGIVSWNVASLPAGGTIQVQFVGQLGHSGQVINDQYRVASSNEGVIGEWGAPVTFTILPPTINANFTQSATTIIVGQSVAFTDASTTNGAPIVAWLWHFGDGQTSALQNPTPVYTAVGVYSVTLQVTDSVGYTAVYTAMNAVIVSPDTNYLYLPLIVK